MVDFNKSELPLNSSKTDARLASEERENTEKEIGAGLRGPPSLFLCHVRDILDLASLQVRQYSGDLTGLESLEAGLPTFIGHAFAHLVSRVIRSL
jgi:hypothetical protein